MGKKFYFDIKAAIPAAWDALWANRLHRREQNEAYEKRNGGRKPYGWEQAYYICAADVVYLVRSFAEDTANGRPWRTNEPSGYVGHGIRLSGNVQGMVRDWLLRGNGGKITGHNFGRGHISGMRFRPVGEPISEAEKTTMARRERSKDRPKPRHFGKSHGARPLCQQERRKGRISFHRSKAWICTDEKEVTCKQCLNLLKKQEHQNGDQDQRQADRSQEA